MNQLKKRIFKECTLRKTDIVVKKRFLHPAIDNSILRHHNVRINSTGFDRNVNDATERFRFIVAVTRELDVRKLANDIEQQEGAFSVLVDI